jgi:hypothetical protein
MQINEWIASEYWRRTTYLQLYCIQLVNALQLKDRMSDLHATQAFGAGAAGAMASFSLAPSPGSKPSLEQLCRINGPKPYILVVNILMTSYNSTIRGQNSSDGCGIRIAILAGPRRSGVLPEPGRRVKFFAHRYTVDVFLSSRTVCDAVIGADVQTFKTLQVLSDGSFGTYRPRACSVV